jgi:aspartate ammonia-lyase
MEHEISHGNLHLNGLHYVIFKNILFSVQQNKNCFKIYTEVLITLHIMNICCSEEVHSVNKTSGTIFYLQKFFLPLSVNPAICLAVA